MGFMEQFEGCIPSAQSSEIPWSLFERLFASVNFAGMKRTPQNPAFHGEGDVYVHTQMVCRELAGNPAFYALPKGQKTALFLAAILHDIGKVKTTRLEEGNWVSPHHAAAGSQIARKLLWLDCGLCGTPERIAFRETVCALIRYHMLPVRLMDREEPERMARKVASIGEMAKGFSWHMLCMLAQADVSGRIAGDVEQGLARVELARMMAEEAGCLDAPCPFVNGFTRYAYFSGRKVQPDQALYDGTWGEVIMLAGLPGTGKDTWIRRYHPDMPGVSLDELRAELGIKPTDDQGKVIQAAKERARTYLRKKEPFIWNATNLTRETRRKLTGLFERYGARTRIVYLETDSQTRIDRNTRRDEAVPESAVDRMLDKAAPPMPDEAQTVEWLCT